MAMLPITIFSREINPALAAQTLRSQDCDLVIDGDDTHWRKAEVRCGRPRLVLTFRNNPDYYLSNDWPEQMLGMQNYFDGFPETANKSKALAIPTTFNFALTVGFEPDPESDNDPRWRVLYAVVQALDGVMFWPSTLADARRRVLYSAGGEDDEDPRAVWPRVMAKVDLSDSFGQELHRRTKPNPEHGDATNAPSAERVARRALALSAVTARAVLEQNPAFLDSLNPKRSYLERIWRRFFLGLFGWGKPAFELLEWVEAVGIKGEFEPKEWEIVQCPLGRLSPRNKIDSTWRLEGLVVLAWSLGLAEMPPHDELVEFYAMWDELGLLDVERAKSLLLSPKLRSREEIRTLRGQLFAVHWRLRNFELDGKRMDFAEFAKTCWFGPLDISNLKLKKGDLTINGVRIDHVPTESLDRSHSTAIERHIAANWLWDGPELYSKASADT